ESAASRHPRQIMWRTATEGRQCAYSANSIHATALSRTESQQPRGILPINPLALVSRNLQAVDDLDSLANVRTWLRLKGRVGGKQHLVNAEEREAASRGG